MNNRLVVAVVVGCVGEVEVVVVGCLLVVVVRGKVKGNEFGTRLSEESWTDSWSSVQGRMV